MKQDDYRSAVNIRHLLTEVINQFYLVPESVIEPLIEEDWRCLYRVKGTGTSWLLRAYSHPNSQARQQRMVAVLELLAANTYPAPRLIYAANGAAMVERYDWHIVMTTFIEGDVIESNTPTTLQQLGQVLGKLHALSETLPVSMIQALPLAGWTPTSQFTPFALQEMLAIVDAIPHSLQTVYVDIVQALRSLSPLTDLPEGLLHNDCVPTNAVMSKDDVPVLIDWADAGRGPLLIDLAWLLIQSDGGLPRTPPLEPDRARLYAIIDGYCEHRVLTIAENAAMLDALRYVPTVWSGLEFVAALRGENTEHPWQWWWERFHAAAVAAPLIQERVVFHQHFQSNGRK